MQGAGGPAEGTARAAGKGSGHRDQGLEAGARTEPAEESGQHAKGWKGKREMGLTGTHREDNEAGEEQRGKSGGQMHPKRGQDQKAAARQRRRRGE